MFQVKMLGKDGLGHLAWRLLIPLDLRTLAAARYFIGSVPSVGVVVRYITRVLYV